jgi:hypothetical protein
MKAAGIPRGRNEREFDAGAETEYAFAGDFDVTIPIFIMKQFMFLTTTTQKRRDRFRIQQETHTVCPFTETCFLPGDRGRPRCFSICTYASSDEIERREDKISRIRSSLISGRTFGVTGPSAFMMHDGKSITVRRQAGFCG